MVIPAAVAAVVLAAILVLLCCLRRRWWRKKRPLPPNRGGGGGGGGGFSNGGLHHGGSGTHLISAATSSIMGSGGGGGCSGSPRSLATRTQPSSMHNYSEMEMNTLLPTPHLLPQPPQQQPPPPPPLHQQQQQQQPQYLFSAPKQPRAKEFPITSVRFNQEMGEGSYGKVYGGDLGGIVGGGSTQVVIKTLRPGANAQTRQDFHREIELWNELRGHPNVVQLLGVVVRDDPQCLVFEHPGPQGDLHEFLLRHSPGRAADSISDISDSGGGGERVMDPSDMSFMAIQIAAGMEYLAGRNYVHRDLAARNIMVGDNLTVKISDFGLSRDSYAADYYRVQSKSLLPVRWMPPESILYGKFTTESDVWSFGVLLWEIYSYGLQPYYGYSNQEVIEMIRSRQLLPCPEDCPSRMYAFMVECWHELPTRRPQFGEIHARLRHWEGMSTGYQSTSHSLGNASHHSHNGSQHSSTGPSNNTGSTNVSQQMLLQQQQQQQQQQQHHQSTGKLSSNGGYSRPFGHLMNPPPPPLPPSASQAAVQVSHVGGAHTVLLATNGGGAGANGGASGGAGNNPFLNGAAGAPQGGAGGASVASLQMV